MRVLIALAATSGIAAGAVLMGPTLTDDTLPDGDYLLVEDVLPGVRNGDIPPVYVHASTQGSRIDWTFFAWTGPSAEACAEHGKCQHFVQALSHDIEIGPEGTITHVTSMPGADAGQTIDWPGSDSSFILDEIDQLIRGATLDLDRNGGTLTAASTSDTPRTVTFLPATLNDADAAVAYAGTLSLPLARLNHCVTRQAITALTEPDPNPAMNLVAQAVRFAGEYRRAQRAADYHVRVPADPGDAAQDAEANARKEVFALVVSEPAKAGAIRLARGDELRDAELEEQMRQTLARIEDGPSEEMHRAARDIRETWKDGALAMARIAARVRALEMTGQDTTEAACRDASFTLPIE